MDVLAETATEGWLVIDHKSSPSPRSRAGRRRGRSGRYAGQLGAYRDALLAAGRDVAGCYIHFAVTGGLVRIDIGLFNP